MSGPVMSGGNVLRLRGPRCKASTTSGEPCRMRPIRGGDWCFSHDPNKGRARAAARKRGGRHAAAATHIEPARIAPVTLGTVADVQQMLERTLREVMAMRRSVTKARTVGFLASVALRALEAGSFEDRIRALEARVGRAS